MEDLPIKASIVIPASELSWTSVTASGPGGQNVNKVATKVVLRFDLAGTDVLPGWVRTRLQTIARSWLDGEGRIVVTSQATRSQTRNLEDARAKLAALVLSAFDRPRRRRATRVPRREMARRREAKRRRSQTKRDRQGRRSED